MNTKFYQFKNLFTHYITFCYVLFLMFLVSCMPDSLTKFKKNEVKKTPPVENPGTGSDPAKPDLKTLQFFQVKNITQKNTTYQLHKYGAGNSTANCEIKISDLTDGQTLLTDEVNDIVCWLEADETQLYFNGADFQTNIPAGYCDYIQVRPYYFWNAPPVNTQKTLKSVTCENSSVGNCVALGGPNVLSDYDLSCLGNYTAAGGPNCDEGYVRTISYSVDALNVVTATSSYAACGGKRTSCLLGPGVDFSVDKYGYPRPIDYLAITGESINYSVTAPGPLGKGYGSNKYIANFTSNFTTGLNTYDYTTIGSSTGMEMFSNTSQTTSRSYTSLGITNFDPSLTGASLAGVDLGQDPLKSADAYLYQTSSTSWTTLSSPRSFQIKPFYEFSCLNYAHEVKGRVRVQIREWNQIFQTPVASFTELAEASPIRLLKQSANATDYETSGVGYWNDISNWDAPFAFGPNTGAVPTTPNDITSYGFNFPYLGY